MRKIVVTLRDGTELKGEISRLLQNHDIENGFWFCKDGFKTFVQPDLISMVAIEMIKEPEA